MVNQSTHSKLFPGVPYPGPTEFDTAPEHPILQLAPEGVVASLERMANVLLADWLPELEALLKVAYHQSPPPVSWEQQPPGWSKLVGGHPIPYPPVKVSVLDSETLVKQGEFPVMVVALGSDGEWYCWKTPNLGEYIPLAPGSLIIGHNVSYDAALIKGRVYALDTQVLATQVSGFCTEQQWVGYGEVPDRIKPIWGYVGYGKGNYKSLADTAKFYLGETLDKEIRNRFVEADSLDELVPEWSKLLSYCALDVLTTHRVLRKLYPLWKAKAPSPVTLMGCIISNSYRLPLAPDWFEWLVGVEKVYHQTKEEISNALAIVAEEWVKQGCDYDDPWHQLLDWTVKPKTRLLKGYPEWYRKAYAKDSKGVTLKSVLGHTLLKVEYLGKPVKWDRKNGYHTVEGKIPHPDGTGDNVGYLFSQDFLPLYESGALVSKDPRCKDLIEKAYSIAYWQAVRKRALGVRVQDGWTVPQTGGGTVTGRVTEPLWLTTCDPKPKRIGSELKSRIQAPPGHKLLIADFSGQELRLAWLLGDARVGKVGGTPMSRAGISGDKSLGTDSHTMLSRHMTEAANAPMSRDVAKTVGFAMQYGGGVKCVANTVALATGIPLDRAMTIAKSAIEYRKGHRVWRDGISLFEGGSDSESINAIAQLASQDRPRTPLLKREMPDPLMPRYVGKDFATTRNNFIIQASARDLLDCLSVAVTYLCNHYNLGAMLAWSRHDEVLMVVPDHEVGMVAEVLQQAHAWTWAAFHEAIGLYSMPSLGLWFDDINVDTVCRKEVNKPTVTPSNPIATPDGYLITPADIQGISKWDIAKP